MIQEITIPDIGENITEGNVVGVLVKKGDRVDNEQAIIEFETDKAVVEIPAPERGKITEISVKEGDTVKVGAVIAKLETEGEGGEVDDTSDEKKEGAKQKEGKKKDEEAEEKKAKGEAEDEQEAGEEEEEPKQQKSKKDIAQEGEEEEEEEEETEEDREDEDADADAEGEEKKEKKATKKKRPAARSDMSSGADAVSTPGWSVPWIREDVAPASPSVRRLARELGADIRAIEGSGPEGRITMDDVKQHVKQAMQGSAATGATTVGQPDLPDFSKWGEIKRESMNKVREITAKSMATAWNVVPHVTQFDKADITDLEEFRKKYAKKVEKAGGKLTVTAILLKVLALGLEKYPKFNASIDVNKNEIIYKNYVHIAMAVDTDRGLLVPVLRDVNKKSITDIALDVVDLADRTRKKKIKPEELEGGSFTVSNQGSIGGTDFTPIVYWPQVAILGVSRSSIEPKWIDGEVKPRMILPLSLSYDHRIIDGADAARFMRWLCEALENPLSMYFE